MRNSSDIVATRARALAPANRTITGKKGRRPSRKMYLGKPTSGVGVRAGSWNERSSDRDCYSRGAKVIEMTFRRSPLWISLPCNFFQAMEAQDMQQNFCHLHHFRWEDSPDCRCYFYLNNNWISPQCNRGHFSKRSETCQKKSRVIQPIF